MNHLSHALLLDRHILSSFHNNLHVNSFRTHLLCPKPIVFLRDDVRQDPKIKEPDFEGSYTILHVSWVGRRGSTFCPDGRDTDGLGADGERTMESH